MKLFVVVLLVGVVSSARLENTYLPPGSAQTAGGNGQFLNTPFAGQASNGHLPSTQYGSPLISARQPDVSQYAHQGFGPGPSRFNGAPIGTSAAISAQKSLAPSPVYGPANIRSNNPEARANTLRADNTNDGSGNYHFEYETENRISQSEQGQLKPVTDGDATVVHGSYSYAGDDGKLYTVNYIADENGFQPSGEHIDQAISMTASDAARAASSENQHGYSYNTQKGYSAQNGYRQGYTAQQQQGLNVNQAGVNGYQVGLNTHQPGFSTKQQGVGGQQTYSQYEANKGGYRY